MEFLSEKERFESGGVPRDLELGAFAIKLIITEEEPADERA